MGSASLVHTIGHGTRAWEDFLDLLRSAGVECVADVRKMPGSRRNPQYNQEHMARELEAAGIGYRHFPALGGLRRPRPGSINTGWRNRSFQGYADYMQTDEFGAGMAELLELARRKRLALLCAEIVQWRCHRSLIADALVVRGFPVKHILSATRIEDHLLRSWARVHGTVISYPADATQEARE